jgi:hypothetical protein
MINEWLSDWVTEWCSLRKKSSDSVILNKIHEIINQIFIFSLSNFHSFSRQNDQCNQQKIYVKMFCSEKSCWKREIFEWGNDWLSFIPKSKMKKSTQKRYEIFFQKVMKLVDENWIIGYDKIEKDDWSTKQNFWILSFSNFVSHWFVRISFDLRSKYDFKNETIFHDQRWHWQFWDLCYNKALFDLENSLCDILSLILIHKFRMN